MKSLVFAALLLINNAAFGQAEITMSRSVKLTAEEASSRVFHVKMPERSVLVLNIDGNDKFSAAIENSNQIDSSIDEKTAFFEFGLPGNYSVGASTVCGIAISVVVEVYENVKDKTISIEDNLPKVVIEAPENCVL
ncbi:hypothetical protein [uncultured Idiomarina sp.]|uniref:hypothetical protein n=1 Tax=uncultured Idiomarina sp. TaxID=352961 RepID=UPI002593FDAA|nr:hypothetical protein [uncultured Idiomarina sp.]